jgi:two-component system osmolarity sensor histidine kinase EnvZ
MSTISARASPLIIARPRAAWRRLTRAIAGFLPKGLYGRSLLIVILPMVLLQAAVAYVFMQRHWELVTHRLSAGVARDVGAIIDLYKAYPPAPGSDTLQTISSERFHIDVEMLPPGPLPPPMPKTFFGELDPVTRALPDEIFKQIRRPFWIDTVGRSGLMEIRVDLGNGVLRMLAHRNLAYEPNVHIFILWMLGAAIVLLAVAILFLRNQIRPILRLARAAENFGKGRDFDFQPHGAREVR